MIYATQLRLSLYQPPFANNRLKSIICSSDLLNLSILQANAPVVKIDGYEVVPENDENALLKAVANQPVSVAIDASGSDLQFYSEVKYSVTQHFF